jgi:hypothetical protein
MCDRYPGLIAKVHVSSAAHKLPMRRSKSFTTIHNREVARAWLLSSNRCLDGGFLLATRAFSVTIRAAQMLERRTHDRLVIQPLRLRKCRSAA